MYATKPALSDRFWFTPPQRPLIKALSDARNQGLDAVDIGELNFSYCDKSGYAIPVAAPMID